MEGVTNFPDDPRLKDLPERFRKRFRGRSVPSPTLQADRVETPMEEFLVAKTVIPVNVTLTEAIRQTLFIAASDWVVEGIAIAAEGTLASLSLVAIDVSGNETKIGIKLDSKKPVTIINGFENINFLIKAGEKLALESDADAIIIGSLELVQIGGKIIRAQNDPNEGNPPGDSPE